MNSQLVGKTALITGAAQGIGLHVSRALARAGMRIAGTDLRANQLDQEMKGLATTYGVATLAAVADVRDEDEIRQAVGLAVDRFGHIDALVNNAGIRKVSSIWETSTQIWDEIVSANLRSQFLVTREVLTQSMLERGQGKIVFVSSIAGRRGTKNSAAYCASKWGIRGLAFATAQDLKGKNINVTVVTPGRTDTPMARNSEQWNPEIGWLSPEAIAKAILFFVEQDRAIEIPEIHLHDSAEL